MDTGLRGKTVIVSGGRGSKPEARILSESPMETTTG